MMMRDRWNQKYGGPRGFTLIELMIAVAIVAVLAALAIFAYGRQVRKARLADMESMMLEIAAKQAAYEGFVGRFAGSAVDAFCPPVVGAGAVDFNVTACGNAQVFDDLGITVPRSTYFQYQILAGSPGPGDDCAAPGGLTMSQSDVCGRIDNNAHWWVIVARADQNGNGVFAEFVTDSTLGGRVIRFNETE